MPRLTLKQLSKLQSKLEKIEILDHLMDEAKKMSVVLMGNQKIVSMAMLQILIDRFKAKIKYD